MADTSATPRADSPVPYPVRILVQSKSHLLPGGNYVEKFDSMADLICQYHWQTNRIFPDHIFQMSTRNVGEPHPHRTVFLVLDHGLEDAPPDAEQVPILFYSFDGKTLQRHRQGRPDNVLQKVRSRYPFRKPPPRPSPRAEADGPPSPLPLCEAIMRDLRGGFELSLDHLAHLRDNREDAMWVKTKVKSPTWEDGVVKRGKELGLLSEGPGPTEPYARDERYFNEELGLVCVKWRPPPEHVLKRIGITEEEYIKSRKLGLQPGD